MTTLDNIDLKILRILQRDSRKSISEIAEALDLSRPTVRKRIRKMLKLGIIKRFTILVDDEVLGGTYVIYRFKTDDTRRLIKELNEMDEFIEIYLTSGEKNIVGLAVYKDMEEFREAMNKFLSKGIFFEAELIIKKIKSREDYIPILKFRLTCDYCGKVIEGDPIRYTLYNREFYFCCKTCLNNFRRMR